MTFNLTAQKRGVEKAQDLRKKGILPAVLYGSSIKPVSLAVEYNLFSKLYSQAGNSSLVDLKIEGTKEPMKVLIQDVQYEPVKGKAIHVDFRGVRMDKEMETQIELHFVGESPAVKEMGGTLIKSHAYINVKCLPKDLVGSINVDVGVLKSFSEIIRIKDLNLPTGIKVMGNLDTVVAKVLAPLTEEQLKAIEETGPKGVEEVEVEKKGKEEVEGEAEGEAVPAGDADKKTDKKPEAPKKEEHKS